MDVKSKKVKTYFYSVPGKLRLLIILSVVAAIFLAVAGYNIYSNNKQVEETLRTGAAPSTVTAENISTLLAGANADIMNVLLTDKEDYGTFWDNYRYNMSRVMLYLITAANNIEFKEEKHLINNILINLAEYENGVGYIRGKIDSITNDDIAKINVIMSKELLPTVDKLGKTNSSYLDKVYNSFNTGIAGYVFVFIVFMLIFIGVLVFSQIYIFRKTHRIINPALALATLVFIAYVVTSSFIFINAGSHQKIAKESAFDSVNALMKAKSAAYSADADVSLYLLYTDDAAKQQELYKDFKAKTALISFKGENKAVKEVLNEWEAYIKIDEQIRALESQGKHDEAVALCVGTEPGQSNWQFSKFDTALDNLIKINQDQFYINTQNAFNTLKLYPYILAISLILIVLLSVYGIKKRLDEYRY